MNSSVNARTRERLSKPISTLDVWQAQLRAETRPASGPVTQHYCDCGNVCRTSLCADCIRREIARVEGANE